MATPGIEESFPPLDLSSKCSLFVVDSEDDGKIDVVKCDNDVFNNYLLIEDIPVIVDWLNGVYEKFGGKNGLVERES